ncbi:Ribosomal protein S18 acetylase RimI [Cognatiyoonia koreensis]|uniref:Ribosomal protein S18 acetylase RimI n=1 Tax=Cognatiyoonia koreensis TaxID=364200 RepID=A0A1I0QRA8_9RHOB|nr:GNAT family N-acetyltransferase [Cognatiyoonia koreensis]SEW30045.1 Ribosomal protein S18 acetylase RimI [Cognatiyoonia koreensis]
MSDTITLVHLRPDDFDRLMAVPEGLFDNAIVASQARAFLTDPLHECVLAYADDLAVGMATGTILLHPDKQPAMFINEVGVRESYQRRGIGRAVTEALIAVAREKGCKGIWLGTELDNAPALALYRSMCKDELQGVFFGWDDGL